MSHEDHVRLCEGVGVKLARGTRPLMFLYSKRLAAYEPSAFPLAYHYRAVLA